MKRQFSFLWAAFAILIALQGCSPYIQSTPTPAPALVTVECRDGSAIRQMVLQLLRSGRGKDISVKPEGSGLEITAAFNPVDTPPGLLARIIQDLNELDGVMHVEVVENPHPIRQNF